MTPYQALRAHLEAPAPTYFDLIEPRLPSEDSVDPEGPTKNAHGCSGHVRELLYGMSRQALAVCALTAVEMVEPLVPRRESAFREYQDAGDEGLQRSVRDAIELVWRWLRTGDVESRQLMMAGNFTRVGSRALAAQAAAYATAVPSASDPIKPAVSAICAAYEAVPNRRRAWMIEWWGRCRARLAIRDASSGAVVSGRADFEAHRARLVPQTRWHRPVRHELLAEDPAWPTPAESLWPMLRPTMARLSPTAQILAALTAAELVFPFIELEPAGEEAGPVAARALNEAKKCLAGTSRITLEDLDLLQSAAWIAEEEHGQTPAVEAAFSAVWTLGACITAHLEDVLELQRHQRQPQPDARQERQPGSSVEVPATSWATEAVQYAENAWRFSGRNRFLPLWWSEVRRRLAIRDPETVVVSGRAVGRKKGGPTAHDVDPLDRFSEAVAGFARRYATGRRGKATADMVAPFIEFYRHGRDVLDKTHEGRVALGMLTDVLERSTGDDVYHDRGIPCLARYPGGKCQSSDWIIPLLPKHKVYVEMFGGVASVLLRKPRAEVEVYNDISGLLAETLAVLSHQKAAAKLQRLALEYAANGGELADRYFELRDAWLNGRSLDRIEPDILMRALVFLYGLRMYQTPIHAERMTYAGGLGPGQNALQMQRWLRLVLETSEISSRLAGVVTYQQEWQQLAKRLEKSAKSHKWKGDDVLVYCDPPYPLDAISDGYNALYGEAGDAWGSNATDELIEWAVKCPWKVAVSGMLDRSGKSPYRQLERHGYKLHKQQRRRSTTRGESNAKFTECLWIRNKGKTGRKKT